MATRVLLLLLSLATLRAAAQQSKKEQRLDLDMGLFDAHLAWMDRCLRGLPEVEGATWADCLTFTDMALARCEENFGKELEACVVRGGMRDPPGEGQELLPALKKFRD